VLIQSGAAAKIAETIVDKIGESKAIIALAIARMVLTMVGVFIDVAVITVSPIALAIAKRVKLSRTAILLARIGGGKAGICMSPNPNAIAAADNMGVSITSV
ncbi:GntP family permease, partial [Clostridium sp. HCS.1]